MKLVDRFPTLVSLLASAGFLGLFQSVLLVWTNQDFGGMEMVLGMSRFGMASGFLTMLLLLPAAVLLRRLHPAGRGAERHRVKRHRVKRHRVKRHLASWPVFFGLAAAVAGWMAADRWAEGPLVSDALEPWFEAVVALVAGLAVSSLRPPSTGWRTAAALGTLILVVLSLLPFSPERSPDAAASASAGPDDARPDGARPDGARPEPVRVIGAPNFGVRPDVVLVTIDTLRADFLGAYGYSPSLTPEMDRVAGEGVVFERTLAAAPWTVPSVASLLTGLPSLRHGAGQPLTASGPAFLRSALKNEHTTLAEFFVAAGYRTRAVVSNGFLSTSMGMGQGFEVYENLSESAMIGVFMGEVPLGRLVIYWIGSQKIGDFRAEGVTKRALTWLAEQDERPLFLWVHYIDPHAPLLADPSQLNLEAFMDMVKEKKPEVLDDGTLVGEAFSAVGAVRGGAFWLGSEDRAQLREYYGRAVRYTDKHVGRLYQALRERGGDRGVVSALTSDHGEEFWDHGHFEHGHDYYREVTRVPLIVWGTPVPEGRRVEGVTGLVDVGPTLLELAGLALSRSPAIDEGRSLVNLWRGGGEDAPVDPRVRFSGGNLYGLPTVLLEEGPWRYILRANEQQELYDVTQDPKERFNVVSQHPELAMRFQQILKPRLDIFVRARAGVEEEMSPEMLKALKALGYVQ